ncbi:FG-GAP and VCBS repeat-containing protein [Streptomyces sp. NBC_01142]|uniref:FG-GAP and VCBS repeat-containing protein n=1 Tax=Streptomyces sp. NBC_01142 TaxID=2975865 RepID=UPI00224EDA6C|nr:FG-GAP and VCBS repeat-containing protein [Streptomyces sp. NBC_01142]MCX4825959.1 FG-GAP and VCBS repeat-containing protein [Streptomyces sp. NBC_01142]
MPSAPSTPSVYSDFDGDGVSDLVITDTSATVNGKYAAGYAAVVHGSSSSSADGPNLERQQVITQNSLNLGKAGQGGFFGTGTVSADLDSDGLADLIAQAGRNTVFVIWGGKDKLAGAARQAGRAPLAGDFDGDGYADLVTAGGTPSTATLSYGPFTRTGIPSRTKALDLAPDDPTYYTAEPTAVGDMTGDGRDDLVVTWSHVFADEIPVPRATVVYRGTADGLSAAGPRLKDGRGKDMFGSHTLTADVNKDGHDDVIVGLTCEILGEVATPAGGSRLMISYGGPEGASSELKPVTINEKTPGLPGSPSSSSCGFGFAPATGDVNGDGYADVAFAAPTSDNTTTSADNTFDVLVLRGGPEGLTGKGAQNVPGFPATVRVALLDLNGDRAAELAIGTVNSRSTDDHVRILRGGPSGVDTTSRPTLIGPEDLRLKPVPGDRFGSGFGH